MKVYVASSWRNPLQPAVVSLLRGMGHLVYDYRHPRPNEHGFSWSTIDPDWRLWSPEQFRHYYQCHEARKHFEFDFSGMRWCDAGLLVLPSGRDSHLEIGWLAGNGKRTAVYMPKPQGDACLMYNLLGPILASEFELKTWAEEAQR